MVTAQRMWQRLVALVRAHPALVALLGVAVALRIGVYVAYGPAFYFSDTRGYFEFAEMGRPSSIRPYGFSLLLNFAQPTGSIWPVMVLQNLMGLGSGLVIYTLVLRKGGPRWLALLAAAPVLLDAYALVLEHYLLADTMFTFLLIAGFAVLIWEDKLSVKFAAFGGLLLAGAILARTVGAGLVLLIGIYILIRRVGWRPLLTLAAAAGIPLIGYLMWFEHYNGKYSFSTWQDRWMYGRVMSIADCDRLELSKETQPLCERDKDYPYEVDFYVWSHNSPVVDVKRKYIYEFVGEVVSQQPGDFARLVARESWAYFSLDFYNERREPKGTTCPGIWEFAQTISEPGCTPRPVASSEWGDHKGKIPEQWEGALPAFYSHYSKWGVLPGPLMLVGLLVTAGSAVVLVARHGASATAGRLCLDGVLFGASAFALIVGAVATSQFDIRYGVPNIALIPTAAALAYLSIRASLATPPPEPPLVPAPAKPPAEMDRV